jgi:hypothetical protein
MTATPTEIRIPKAELLWREYQISVDLYKFYVDVAIKVVVGYYAVTGGILSFYFTSSRGAVARWALVLPCLVSFAIALLFLWGARLWSFVRNDVFRIAKALDIGSFELSVLSIILRGAAVLLALTGTAMLWLILCRV